MWGVVREGTAGGDRVSSGGGGRRTEGGRWAALRRPGPVAEGRPRGDCQHPAGPGEEQDEGGGQGGRVAGVAGRAGAGGGPGGRGGGGGGRGSRPRVGWRTATHGLRGQEQEEGGHRQDDPRVCVRPGGALQTTDGRSGVRRPAAEERVGVGDEATAQDGEHFDTFAAQAVTTLSKDDMFWIKSKIRLNINDL